MRAKPPVSHEVPVFVNPKTKRIKVRPVMLVWPCPKAKCSGEMQSTSGRGRHKCTICGLLADAEGERKYTRYNYPDIIWERVP